MLFTIHCERIGRHASTLPARAVKETNLCLAQTNSSNLRNISRQFVNPGRNAAATFAFPALPPLLQRGKEGMFFAFLGAAILLFTLAIGGLRMTRSGSSSQAAHATNFSALAGAITGLIFGGFFGAFSGFGRIVIAILNPDLPERDFGRSFGATGGGLLGAFFLAIAGSVLRQWLRPSQTCIPADQQAEESPVSTQ